MKIDMHVHTSASIDGVHSPRTMVKAAKEKGLSGLAITDHDSASGWREALAAGKRFGVLVIPGMEISVIKDGRSAAHILALFLNEPVKTNSMPELADEIHEQDGLAVIAHPLDRWRGKYGDLEKYLEYLDGIEVVNAHTPFFKDNDLAREFAIKHKKAMTGGSDAHSRYEVGAAYTEAKADSLGAFRKALLSGKTRAYGRKANLFYHAFSVLSKRGLYPKEK